MIADIVVGLQYGDEGKGKVTHQLARNGNYTHVLRYNGGCNAGHTIYHEGKKFVTHHIPCGVFYGIPSIIGPGCVVNIKKLYEEIEALEAEGINVYDYLMIAENAHVITDFHIAEDKKDETIGTTKTGNGPAYRDKYGRKGILARDVPELEEFCIDIFDELHSVDDVEVLCEGAQGFGLDIDWGDYPFVTSSHCTTAGVIASGVPHSAIREVWGVGKVYETYVGAKQFEEEDSAFELIRTEGAEFGATTGRPRQIGWLNIDILKRSCYINGVTKIVLNKADILDRIGMWFAKDNDKLYEFSSEEDMEYWISSYFPNTHVILSRSPSEI
jgi:adenylosuccinate synthase